MLSLAAAVVLSQVVYSWVDEKGVTHYTDGATGVPEQAEKTELPPVSVVKRAPENLPEPQPLPEPKPAAAAPVPTPTAQPQAHTTHNPLPDFEYVENPEGMEGTGVYRRFDPWPLVPCGMQQHPQQPCVQYPAQNGQPVQYGQYAPQPAVQPQKPAGPELTVVPQPKPQTQPKKQGTKAGMVSGR